MKNTGVVNIHGREYQTVALRVATFREKYPLWSLTTEILHRDDRCVVMQAKIISEQGRIIATGHAEEYRAASSINKTSALENAETSAIGRALAGLGFGGTEFASADEVARAVSGQKPGVISPVKSAGVDPALSEKADHIASTLIDLHSAAEQGDDKAEYSAHETVDNLDTEMKLAVWNALQPHSKVRSWLKRITQEKKAA